MSQEAYSNSTVTTRESHRLCYCSPILLRKLDENWGSRGVANAYVINTLAKVALWRPTKSWCLQQQHLHTFSILLRDIECRHHGTSQEDLGKSQSSSPWCTIRIRCSARRTWAWSSSTSPTKLAGRLWMLWENWGKFNLEMYVCRPVNSSFRWWKW